jgi:hypothetical protein
VAGDVGVDVSTSFAAQATGAQCEHALAGALDVVHHDVEVELLRLGGVRPPRRSMVRRQLKRQAGGRVVLGDDHPVTALVGDGEPEEL